MPRKTKDVSSKKETKKNVTKKEVVAEKVTKLEDIKAEKSKKTTTEKPKKSTASTKKATATKTTTKKSVVKEEIKQTEKPKKKKETTKKSTAKKTTAKKKTITKAKTKETPTEIEFMNEYYDLPYRYNQTIVTILAQTPTRLFVYWDIADEQIEQFKEQYGESFFEVTKPVLIIHNNTMHYSFEIEINDFANSWYIPINDAKCEYTIELGRRPIPNLYIPQNTDNSNDTDEVKNIKQNIPEYIYISSSNNLKTPNNKVLYNPPIYKKVVMRNVKTNQIIEKDISDFKFIANIESIGEFYDVYGLYAKFYKDEDLRHVNNPASGSITSRSYSSQFK